MLYRNRMNLIVNRCFLGGNSSSVICPISVAAYDRFICGMFSCLESYGISHMPMLLPVFLFLFEHTAVIRLTSHLKQPNVPVIRHASGFVLGTASYYIFHFF